MASLYRDGGLFVHGAFKEVEASEVSREVQHVVHIPAQGFPLVPGCNTAAFPVYAVAYPAQPDLCILDGCEVHTCGKGPSPDIVHAAFHMSFLPTRACVAEAVVKPVESTHAEQRLCRFLAVRLQYDGHLHVIIHHRMGYTVHVVEEVTVRLHEGQVVLMAEQVCPAPLTVAQGKHGHRKSHWLASDTQLDLSPVKLTLLARLVILPDEDFLGLLGLLCLAALYILANTGITDIEALLYQGTMYVLPLQALLAHTRLSTLGIFLQPVLNLRAYRICQAGTLSLTGRVFGLTGKTDVQSILRISLDRTLILTHVACYRLPVKTHSAGYLPQTQTIYTIVMKDLFFFIHVNHFLFSLHLISNSNEPLI